MLYHVVDVLNEYSTHNTLNYSPPHCKILQHTATHCNTLQRIAKHCNTLQHTFIHTAVDVLNNYGMLLHTVLGEYDKAETMYQSALQVYICVYRCVHVCTDVYVWIYVCTDVSWVKITRPNPCTSVPCGCKHVRTDMYTYEHIFTCVYMYVQMCVG